MKRKFANALSLALIVAMLFTSLALADNLQADTDGIVPVGEATTLAFGNVCAGQTYTQNVIFAAKRSGNYGNPQVWANEATVTVVAGTITGNGLSAGMGDNTIVLPSEWGDADNNELSTDTALATITLVPVATGTGFVLFSGSGNGSGGGTTTRSQTINVSWTVINCAPADPTPPVVTPIVSGTLGNNGWYTSDVTVSWSVVDNESAVSSSTGCGSTTITADTAGTTLTCSATSAGGTSSESVTIKRDATAPTISGSASPAANAAGWNNTDVTVSFTCDDNLSGVASCGPDETLSGEGAGQSASGTAFDDAGNSASTMVSGINIDKTEPTLNPDVTPNPVTLNGTATASANADDSLSGVASSSCDAVDTSSVGSHSVSCTATDKAGNTNSASAGYSVAYNWNGFFQPVDNLMLNGAKAGQAIPLKWRLTDANGVPVLNLTSVSVKVGVFACSTGVPTDSIEEYAAGSSGLQNLGDGYYQFNWKTLSTYANSCRSMSLDLGDGVLHTAQFQFKK